MTNTQERTIVELQYNCIEWSKWDIVSMQNDMIKAYGKDYVTKVNDKEIESELREAIEYAEKNWYSIPKNINVRKFIDRMEATRKTIKEKAEEKKDNIDNSEALAEIETARNEISEERKELEGEKEAFETVKSDFAQEKVDHQAEVDAHNQEVEAFEKRLEDEKEDWEEKDEDIKSNEPASKPAPVVNNKTNK